MVEMGDRKVGDRLYTLCSSSLRGGSSPPWSTGFLIGKRSHHFRLIWKYSTHAKACPRIRLMSARSRCERQYPTAKSSTPSIRMRKYVQLIEFPFPFPIHTSIIPSSSDALLTALFRTAEDQTSYSLRSSAAEHSRCQDLSHYCTLQDRCTSAYVYHLVPEAHVPRSEIVPKRERGEIRNGTQRGERETRRDAALEDISPIEPRRESIIRVFMLEHHSSWRDSPINILRDLSILPAYRHTELIPNATQLSTNPLKPSYRNLPWLLSSPATNKRPP